MSSYFFFFFFFFAFFFFQSEYNASNIYWNLFRTKIKSAIMKLLSTVICLAYKLQNQTAVFYDWRAETRNVRLLPFLKSQSSKSMPILQKNVLNQYWLLKAKG